MQRTRKVQYKDLSEWRKEQWEKQDRKCPILGSMAFEESVVDHQHKRKDEDPGGPERKGFIRGVLHFQANAFEGKVAKIYVRYGLHKFIDLPTLLRRLADYLENPPVKEPLLHPSEIPKKKPQKLKKVDANRVYKYWPELYPRRKPPTLPKSGGLTKEWALYVQEAKDMHEQKTGVKLS